MKQQWTAQQVDAMAPDSASISNGKKLSAPAKWQTLGMDDQFLWGEIKGSGKKPYQACIDTSEPAFKCSCPSRKFPCKHALAVAYIFVDSPSAFSESPMPEWVSEWQQRREQQQQKKLAKANRENEPVDEATLQRRQKQQQQREQKRQANIDSGLLEFQQWLNDIARQGLASAMNDADLFKRMSKRLIDIQAPGLARRVLDCLDLRYAYDPWQSHVLQELSRIQLIVSAWRQREALAEEIRADLHELVGISVKKEDILATPGIEDNWWVVAKRVWQQDNLQGQRTWLWGESQQRWALLLDFTVGNQALPMLAAEGDAIQAELVFYPSSWPRRALIKQQKDIVSGTLTSLGKVGQGIPDMYKSYAQVLNHYPWLEQLPFGLSQAIPIRQGDQWLLLDQDKYSVPIATRFNFHWQLLSASGGHPITVFGEWDGFQFLPLSMIAEEQLISFNTLQIEVA